MISASALFSARHESQGHSVYIYLQLQGEDFYLGAEPTQRMG